MLLKQHDITRVTLFIALVFLLSNWSFSQTARLWSEVRMVDGENEAELFWEGVDDLKASKVEYRIAPGPNNPNAEWQSQNLNEDQGSITIGPLTPDRTYEWRLDGMDLFSDVFRTYQTMAGERFRVLRYTVDAVAQKNPPVSKVYDQFLQFRYVDEYLTDELIRIELYNQHHLLVGRLAVAKEKSGNYAIDLAQIAVRWSQDETYLMVLNDGLNTEKRIRFQLSEPLGDPLEVQIVVDPVFLECQEGSTSVIDYYGDFKGGNPTYEIAWTIVDAEGQTPLLPPKQEVVLNESSLPKFTIDHPLPYLLVLSVKDDCGNFGEHAVMVHCEPDEEKESSILLEYVQYDRVRTTN